MSRTDPQFKLRMPPALRARVEQAAKASMRSLNAELVFRVEQSFEGVELARVLSSNPINALLGFLEGYLLHAAEHPSEPFNRALMLIDGLMDSGYLSQPEESYLTDLRVEALAWGRARQDKEEADHVVSELLAPNPCPGLRLLCVLVRKAGRCAVVQPISVYGLPAPWAALSGRWPLALPSPFLLRETRPVPASAEVLARCVRQREAHALCARARSISIGGLTHAR
ncbi:Arc family DNA-binding protein [Pseudomonas aeruginosa]|nr:regulatory protein [Pseudomonas aeruginosa]MCO2188989.1 Arc family DNA-binding protein [Pseudomonas aeruginosa]MDV6699732.1 Arc family DNA-binding protein [Pseudomonas aeruginosa]OXT59444.1 Arc family DNA-binding protein [Pseudomonas aeruginosa]PBY66116.1 Arc family DNA-binding protein [Pseudomonas aeruginosa]